MKARRAGRRTGLELQLCGELEFPPEIGEVPG
jgi:hypothetical protein